jgi:hypothetical protein
MEDGFFPLANRGWCELEDDAVLTDAAAAGSSIKITGSIEDNSGKGLGAVRPVGTVKSEKKMESPGSS